ncbi:high light inducible protein [Synechococcus sp. AH-551-N17]|nr:high light inducible protein [Synechococcus sp. AH-551-N17]
MTHNTPSRSVFVDFAETWNVGLAIIVFVASFGTELLIGRGMFSHNDFQGDRSRI